MKALGILVSLLALLVGLSVFYLWQAPPETTEPDSNSGLSLKANSADSVLIELEGLQGVTVLDLLKRDHEVSIKASAMGDFVIAIDSLENSTRAFWLFSVNDSMPQIGCDRMITNDSDRVVWHFRKIE